MDIGTRLGRAGLYAVLGAGAGATVWLATSYAQGEPLDYAGAVAFAASFGIGTFLLQFLWGRS